MYKYSKYWYNNIINSERGVVMIFSEYFDLKNVDGHSSIDFIDIDIVNDTKLFIDPSLIEGSNDIWCNEASILINSFFNNVFECYGDTEEKERLMELLNYGHEPNETKLGLSESKSKGKGTSDEGLYQIFKDIYKRDLVNKKLIEKPMDLCVFVHDFDKDRMSDLVTNILRKKLCDFTLMQCKKHNFDISDNEINIGKSWNYKLECWEDVVSRVPLVNDEPILLVPKKIVRRNYIYSVNEYLNKKVLEHRQQYHVENNTELAQLKYSKARGEYIAPPSKRTIREKEICETPSKDYVTEYTINNPELIIEFREEAKRRIKLGDYTLRDEELDELLYKEIFEE